VGETVKVLLKQSLGFKALFLAYILPFIVVITALFSLSSFVSEGIAGILALLSLIPYYAILYFFKNKISKQFNFDIEKIS
ncbi:MAG TPA: SoxR reducing system RseC family protein, partial [Tenuifilaceae bacterium]|nr:SoxR reducing system RseC family protein [Tenuifilaceae bacterium]